MSNDVVIKVENLSKQYRIGAKEGYRTFRYTLVDATKAPFQRFSYLFNRKSQYTNRNLSGSMPYIPGSMLSSLCDEHERKRMYRFAELILGAGFSISNKKRIKTWALYIEIVRDYTSTSSKKKSNYRVDKKITS